MSRLPDTSPADPNKRPSVGPIKPAAGLRPPSNVTIPAAGAKPLPVGGGGGAARPPQAPPSGGGTSGGGAASAGGMPAIDQLQGRPIGRVLTKMGKVSRE